jgi:hypothetical protein
MVGKRSVITSPERLAELQHQRARTARVPALNGPTEGLA